MHIHLDRVGGLQRDVRSRSRPFEIGVVGDGLQKRYQIGSLEVNHGVFIKTSVGEQFIDHGIENLDVAFDSLQKLMCFFR